MAGGGEGRARGRISRMGQTAKWRPLPLTRTVPGSEWLMFTAQGDGPGGQITAGLCGSALRRGLAKITLTFQRYVIVDVKKTIDGLT